MTQAGRVATGAARGAAAAELRGVVFDIRRDAAHDGPGIRTVVFLKGCPLSCAWCHNPEGLSPEPELGFNASRCLGCSYCIEACPDGLDPRERARAVGCAACPAPCAEACPADALRRIGRASGLAELMAELRADKPFYDASGGGVTFSGGEPLMQAAILEAALLACRAEGIRTAIETSSFAPPETFMRIAQVADLLLLDLKFADEGLHRLHTGVSNAPILANLRAAARAGLAYALRLPLIPGYNDAEGELEAMAELAAELLASWRAARAAQPAPGLSAGAPGLSAGAPGRSASEPGGPGSTVSSDAPLGGAPEPEHHILPYHDAGAGKYALRGLAYPAAGTRAPSRERLERVASVFERRGLCVRIGA